MSTNKAKINLKNIGRFLQGYSRKFSESFGLLEIHKREQVIWREAQASVCTANGSCTYCGCTTPAKYYSDEGCEDPVKKCYPDMMSETEWIAFKSSKDISIKID